MLSLNAIEQNFQIELKTMISIFANFSNSCSNQFVISLSKINPDELTM
ncbi:hypothetical protein DOY81_005883 [Sarcophaga bullata]|nr:hypothetical protein DOY81_005883 [Sarcophaga bullata]